MSFDDLARRMQQRNRDTGDDSPELTERAARVHAQRSIVWGVVWLVAGIVITAATYNAASREGGTYVVAYGPILVGVIKIFRGIGASASSR